MRVGIDRALSQTGQPSFNFLKRGGEALAAIAIIAFQPLRTDAQQREGGLALAGGRRDVSSVQIEIADCRGLLGISLIWD